MTYVTDRERGDRYLPEAIKILERNGYSCDVACKHIDIKEAGDIIVIDGYGKEYTVAFRARHISYYTRYPDQFTIRFRRSNGMATEYEKIENGYGDLLLYCFGNDNDEVEKYALLRLDPIRHRMHQIGESICNREIKNKSNRTSLVWMKYEELPAVALVDSNHVDRENMWTDEQVDWLDEYIAASK